MGKHSRSRVGMRHLLGVTSDGTSRALVRATTTTLAADPVAAHTPDVDPVTRVVYDNDGRELGTITGDRVIGFTVTCWGTQSWFLDVDTAESALLADARSRAPGRYATAS